MCDRRRTSVKVAPLRSGVTGVTPWPCALFSFFTVAFRARDVFARMPEQPLFLVITV